MSTPCCEKRHEKWAYLLENLHLGLGLTIFALLGLGLSHTVTNADKLSVGIFETSSDAVLDRLLDLLLDETCSERFESLVQEIVLRAPDRELERSDLGANRFNLEHRCMVLGRGHELDVHGDTFTAEDEICKARVPEFREAGLFPEVEGDIAKVRLDLAERELDLVFSLVVDDTVGRESEIVPGRYGDDVREQVLAREGEVLDDEVEGIVGVLNTRDGDVTDLADDGRQNNLANVVPKIGFELQRAFAVEEEVSCEASPVLTESLVQRVFTHLLKPVANGLGTRVRYTPFAARRSAYVEEVVKVVLIFIIVEMAAVFADIGAFFITLWFENISWLEEDLASVLVYLLKPVPQFLVPVRIAVQRIDRVLDLVHAPAIGEPFEKGPQLMGGLAEGGILGTNTIGDCRWTKIDSILT